MITALAVETLSVSVLALLSLKASVTLAALVTVIWLPLALLSVWRSAWAWMTLAMIAMLWRAEAWKTVCLATEAQLSQSLQSLPKTACIGQPALSDYVAAGSELGFALFRFRPEAPLVEFRISQSGLDQKESSVPGKDNDNVLLASQEGVLAVYPVPYPASFSYTDLGQRAPIYLISGDLRTPAQNGPIGPNTLQSAIAGKKQDEPGWAMTVEKLVERVSQLREELERVNSFRERQGHETRTLANQLAELRAEIERLRARLQALETEKAHWWAPKLTREYLESPAHEDMTP